MAIYVDHMKNALGGEGEIIIERFLDKEELKGKCKLFGKCIIEPGNSLGYHIHEGDSETYYILSGEGEYNDNGTIRTVKPGDLTVTPSGFGHGIANKGTETLEFMCLIIFD